MAVDNRLVVYFENLKDLYYDNRPDDTDFLDENEEVVDSMKSIEALEPTTNQEYQKALKELTDFLYKWFPDCVCEEEASVIKDDLKMATLLANADDVKQVPFIYTVDVLVEGNKLSDVVHSLQGIIDAIEDGVLVENDIFSDDENLIKRTIAKRF